MLNLENITISPESPQANQPINIKGNIELLGMSFILPAWVVCILEGPAEYVAGSIAVGGDFEISFPKGVPTEGDYALEVRSYLGPTVAMDSGIIPPFPAMDTYESVITVSGGAPPSECTVDSDCPVGYKCINGVCVQEAPPGVCVTDDDCPPGYKCVNGECVSEEPWECVSDDDCEPGYHCVDGKCVEIPHVCDEGDTKCEGYTLYRCINNQWQKVEENASDCGWVPPPPKKAMIYGVVKDSETHAPLGDVNVYAGTFSTTTDSQGNYELQVDGDKHYICGWHKSGYNQVSRSIYLMSGESRELAIYMEAIPGPTGPEITSISPDPCYRSGTITIEGNGFSSKRSEDFIHLVKALTGREVYTMADSATTTKLTLNLAKSLNGATIGEYLGEGMVRVQAMVWDGSEYQYSNTFTFEIGIGGPTI